MFELDKLGIYHGDLNGKNILLESNGTVNFIDYQWTEKVENINFFDTTKSRKILQPLSEFPENAQMFEMALMPWYVDSFCTTAQKERFLKSYLKAKARYHAKRYEHIKKISNNWQYPSELPYIKQALDSERAKSEVYKNPDINVLKIEMKKIQFLSDYRDAYSHVDPNLPNRNIIASPSSYLCSISSVQDFRKEVYKQLLLSTDKIKTDYLKSMEIYGDFWYNNLLPYTSDTFDYIMRMIQKKRLNDEQSYKFYINERNPRIFSPNIELLEKMGIPYKPEYQQGFDTPNFMLYTLDKMYEQPIKTLGTTLADIKSIHQIEKLKGLFKTSRKTTLNNRILDTLNATEVATLKIREFKDYIKHNIASYSANMTLSVLSDNISNFAEELFRNIFTGLQTTNPKNIKTKGYTGMRNYIYKI